MNRAGTLTYAALAAAGDMVSITTADEGAVCTAMLDLYQNEGIIAEPAGALSVAALVEARLEPGSTVVCVISGGNNDVSRYGEVLERSLVHLGLKHYFLVDFPQEPGALRRFLDTVLGPNDDITLFEYVKRNNRETGEALVGVELGSAADFDGLLERMRASDIHVETLEPGSPAYRYLLLDTAQDRERTAGQRRRLRADRRVFPRQHHLAGDGNVGGFGAEVAGDGQRPALHHDPPPFLVVVDAHIVQPRVGQVGLVVPQRDQLLVHAA